MFLLYVLVKVTFLLEVAGAMWTVVTRLLLCTISLFLLLRMNDNGLGGLSREKGNILGVLQLRSLLQHSFIND